MTNPRWGGAGGGCVQRKNMPGLYDVLGTLAEHVGPGMATAAVAARVMPVLCAQWDAAERAQAETGRRVDLFPLLECLASVATALQSHVTPFAGPVYRHAALLASRIVQQHLVRRRRRRRWHGGMWAGAHGGPG